jgi:hypothetical protein
MNTRLVSDIELRGLAEIALPIAAPRHAPEETSAEPRDFKDDEERKKWQQQQQAALDQRESEDKLRREQATRAFRQELDQRLAAAYEAGAQSAVSAEARRSITVRGYVLYTIVAAVVAMPLLAMWLELDPQAFGAFIAPVTGIAGTIVGYWFGTAGQPPRQGITQPPDKE